MRNSSLDLKLKKLNLFLKTKILFLVLSLAETHSNLISNPLLFEISSLFFLKELHHSLD